MKLYEKQVEKMLVDACRRNKIYEHKGFPQIKGHPDRVIYNHKINEIHFVEIKNETYYGQTENQKKWQKIIENAGGKYFLINGEKEMKEYIKKYIENESEER